MKEKIVSFETAKLAKEKDFNWKWLYYIDGNKYEGCYYEGDGNGRFRNNFEDDVSALFIDNLFSCTAPSQSFIQKWLREKHQIHCAVIPFKFRNGKVMFKYYNLGAETFSKILSKYFKTYEECLEEALYEGLKLIKNEKNNNNG